LGAGAGRRLIATFWCVQLKGLGASDRNLRMRMGESQGRRPPPATADGAPQRWCVLRQVTARIARIWAHSSLPKIPGDVLTDHIFRVA
jgi:hypothetical protein